MTNIYLILLIVLLGLQIFSYSKRKKNLKTLIEQLESGKDAAGKIFGHTVSGSFKGRSFVCYSDTRSTRMFMSSSPTKNRKLKSLLLLFSFPRFWPKVTLDCTYKDGIVFYSGFGIFFPSFYFKTIPPHDFRDILDKLAAAAELVQQDEGRKYSSLVNKSFNYRALLVSEIIFLIGGLLIYIFVFT